VTTPEIRDPVFEEILVEADLTDGYWLQAVDVNGDGRPDLVASGLAEGHVVWYQNPTWTKHVIATFDKPVALDAADIAGDGRADLVISHDYGQCMFDCGPQDGRISWLRNPGAAGGDREWERRPIGDLVATHRLRLGRFTRPGAPQLLALPVVAERGGPDAVHAPVRLTLFEPPDDVLSAAAWPSTIVDEETFRIIHGVQVRAFAGTPRPDLDSLLIASEEGVSWFGVDSAGAWRSETLGTGELTQQERTGFQGSGNLAVGRIGTEAYAYVAAVEPFHGNTVVVYTRDAGPGLVGGRWRRTVLDVFGDPNANGEGAGHHVVAGDFDGDGDDEFLVAMRGPMPWQGVFYYKAVDAANGLFVKKRVSTASAARIAVADFDGDGCLDFATTGYYTPGYFLCEDPQVKVFLNRFSKAVEGRPPIPAGPDG
jgi:hypothetical protein